MRKILLIISASITFSVSAVGADMKNESLDTFHGISTNTIKECQDQNYDGLRNIEAAISLSIAKTSAKYDLMKQARGYGMPDKVNQIKAEIETELVAFISKRDGMIKELSDSANTCLKNGVAELKSAFPKANDSIKKKAALSKMLKDYFANTLTVINGSVPATNETSTDYKKRQDEATTKTSDLWNRFDVEASY